MSSTNPWQRSWNKVWDLLVASNKDMEDGLGCREDAVVAEIKRLQGIEREAAAPSFQLLYEAHMKTLEELRLAKDRLAALAEQQAHKATIITVPADPLRAQIAGQVLAALYASGAYKSLCEPLEYAVARADELLKLLGGK